MTETKHVKPRILVAEDNPINQKVIKAILEMRKYQYEIVFDGNQAISTYSPEKFDLILMDCQMPKVDGLRATQRIREIETEQKWQRCPIIALTANAMAGDREKCTAAGMDDFLPKPFKSMELVEKLDRWGKS